MKSKVTIQCERSLGNSSLRAKKPRSARALLISGEGLISEDSDSPPKHQFRKPPTSERVVFLVVSVFPARIESFNDSGSLSWLSGTIQVEEGKPSSYYLNLLLKPNNFFFREPVNRFVLDELKGSPIVVREPV